MVFEVGDVVQIVDVNSAWIRAAIELHDLDCNNKYIIDTISRIHENVVGLLGIDFYVPTRYLAKV